MHGIPSPPLWEHWLFEAPLVPMVVLGLAGFVMIVVGSQRRAKALRAVGLAMLLLAAAVGLTATQVTTPRERIARATLTFLATTAPLDTPALLAHLDPACALIGPDGSVWLTREQIVDALQQLHRRTTPASHSVLQLQCSDTQSLLDVKTRFSSGTGFPALTRWLMTWRTTDDHTYVLTGLQWLPAQGPNAIQPTEGLWR